MNNRLGSLWFLLKATLGLTIFVVLLVKLAAPIGSNDIWWHMALGRMHLSTGSLIIDHSVFTWSPATAYHAYNSWLSDIVLYLIYDLAGVIGLQFVKYSVFILIFTLMLHFAIKRGVVNNPLTWLIVLLGFGLCLPSFIIKPEIFSLLFMVIVIWLYYHIRAEGDRAWLQTYYFPLIIVLWANIHGAFFLSALFFTATIIGELLNIKYSPDQAMKSSLRKHYFIALFLCIPAVLLNPYGIDLPLTIVELVFDEGAQYYNQVSAYQPTYLFNDAPYFLLDYMIFSMLLFVILLLQKMKLRKIDWVSILSFVIYSLLFIQMARTTYYLAPVFVFAALDMLRSQEKSIFWPVKIAKKALVISVSTLVICALLIRATMNEKNIINDPFQTFNAMQVVAHNYPQAEVDYIEANLQGDKIGNIYRDGGYLMYRLWPEKKVLIDPRYFPFKSWIDDYFKFTQVDLDMQEFLNSNKADCWLINYNKISLFEWFSRSDKWRLAFFGPVGGVFVPRDEFNGVTLFSSEIANLRSAAQMTRVLNAAILLNKTDLVREIRHIANINVDSYLPYKNNFLDEIDSIILAMDALNNTEYEKAAELYANTQFVSFGRMLSAKIYRYLASKAWFNEDYIQARKWSISAYAAMEDKSFLDVYNIALTDWHARSVFGNSELLNDSIEWNKFADLMLNNSNLIKNKELLAVVESMKNRTYSGDAELFQKSILLDNELDQIEKNRLSPPN